MALNYYDDRNKVVETGKTVFVEKHFVRGAWYKTLGPNLAMTYTKAWLYTRRCNCRYTYVGMNETAANNCVNAMKTKYNRTTYYSLWNTDSGIFTRQLGANKDMARISLLYKECGQWDVIIDVDEYDEYYSITPTSPDFSYLDNRTYYETN